MAKISRTSLFVIALFFMLALEGAGRCMATELADRCEPLRTAKTAAELQAVSQEAVDAAPADGEARFYLGVAYFLQRKTDEAIEHLEKAVAATPDNCEYRRALGDAYGLSALKSGMFAALSRAKKCKAAYEKAVELDPKNVQARVSLGMFYMQAPGIAGGSRAKAYEQIGEIEKLDAEAGWKARIGAYFADKKFPEIRAMLDEKNQVTPESYYVLYSYGRLSAQTGDGVDDGIEKLQRCLNQASPTASPTAEYVYLELGKNYERKGDRSAARTAYETALSFAPNSKSIQSALEKLK